MRDKDELNVPSLSVNEWDPEHLIHNKHIAMMQLYSMSQQLDDTHLDFMREVVVAFKNVLKLNSSSTLKNYNQNTLIDLEDRYDQL